jgi:hypothetical protein
MHPLNSAAEASNQIRSDRGRGAERGVSVGRADAGNSEIGAPQGQQDGERVVDFAERRSNGSIGVEPNSGCLGAGQGAADEKEKNRDRELETASGFALRY